MSFNRAIALFFLATLLSIGASLQASTAIVYQGQLQDTAGPYSGEVDMTFRLYDSQTDGNQLGPELTRSNVQVEDGLFQVSLDFGNVYSGPRWLEVDVEGSLLTPRQRFAPAPVALRAMGVGRYAAGEACTENADCASDICQSGFCQAPTCSDGLQNGEESGVDCGGPACVPCPAGQSCEGGGDCGSGVCESRVCQAPTCGDGVRNAAESGVDCGGPDCVPCEAGKSCMSSGDCRSDVCVAGSCQEPVCFDGVLNGSESGVDCGGLACTRCSVGRSCNRDEDCESGSVMPGPARRRRATTVSLTTPRPMSIAAVRIAPVVRAASSAKLVGTASPGRASAVDVTDGAAHGGCTGQAMGFDVLD